jgi:uncharacterized damage-inducible protein DinB
MALNPSLIASLREFPDEVRACAAQLPPADATRRRAAGEFAMVEHACHLRDYELEGCQARIRRMLAEKEPFLADFEGDRLARERDYLSQDAGQAWEEFAQARAGTLRVLECLTEPQLALTARFGSTGTITLSRLVEIVAEHDVAHRAEIVQLVEEVRSVRAVSR